MEPTDITLDILRKIHAGMGEMRDELRENTRRLGKVEDRLASLETKVDGQGRRLTSVETRLHELVDVVSLSVTRQIDLARRLDGLEERVAILESKTSA